MDLFNWYAVYLIQQYFTIIKLVFKVIKMLVPSGMSVPQYNV